MTLNFCRHILHFVGGMLALLALPLMGCSGSSDSPDIPSEDQYVTIDLSVAVDNGASSTRAFSDSEDGTFENANIAYEKVHTLRVVIVRPDNTIEHNRMVYVSDAYNDIVNSYYILYDDNLEFKVVAGETKKVYLFANESAVNNNKSLKDIFDFTKDLAEGTEFPLDKVSNLMIVRRPNTAFIDNGTTTVVSEKQYVPMSESFDVTVPGRASANSTAPYPVSLFLTRSLIKFSFSVKTDNYLEIPDYKLYPDGLPFKIIGVRISGLADKGYYLPNKTVYSPAKNTSSSNPYGGRIIESFDTPSNNGYSYYDFYFVGNEIGVTANTDKSVSPTVYFPESKAQEGSKYKVKLYVDNPVIQELFNSQELELTNVPRNTHFKINITIKGSQISASVTVMPYAGVYLNPSFGFDD